MGPPGSLSAPSPERARPGTTRCAPLLEVFASIQGEGLFAGRPQVLVRLAGCPLRCRWCDTPESWSVPDPISAPGDWRSPLEVMARIAAVDPEARRAVSVTGGEPLLWPAFLRGLAPLLGGRRLHLETAGVDPAVLEEVIDVVDHVSLDLKRPADLAPPVPVEATSPPASLPRDEPSWARVRARNLALLRGRDACGKIVVAGGAPAADFLPLLDEVAERNRRLPLFLQPATAVRGVRAPAPSLVGDLVALAEARALDVRVLPQIHPLLGLR